MDSDYIKWMPFITGVLSALIAAVVACFIAMLNNHTARLSLKMNGVEIGLLKL